MNPLRFTVALSFPGEHREFVSQVADHLAATFDQQRVLYDKYHDEEFARLDLNTYLPALYRKESELIVIFLCPEYAAKLWCRLEWRHVSQLIATVDAKRVMFLSFGNPGDLSDLGILSGDGYIDILSLTPETVAKKIVKRLRLNQGVQVVSNAVADRTPTVPNDISRIVKYAPTELIGREAETQILDDAWDKVVRGEKKRPRIFTFVALGGEGKTSLVAKWAADLAYQDWPRCDAVFAWSFYSQGTREQTAVSSDSFLAAALTFFGDEELAGSAVGAFDKGRRLAQLVGERRTLLILDGLEPLQYAPTSPTPGELKDAGMAALLKGLAVNNNGLCVVTTRYAIHDLRGYWRTTAPWHQLACLSTAAGVKLLQTIGVRGSLRRVVSNEGGELFNEFEKLVADVDGHALTLQIVGQFLVRAFHGDIRLRDRIDIQKADSKIQGGHAFRVMETYVKWLEDESEESRRELAVLRLLGLFDRPATADCIDALRATPAIPGLTEPLMQLAEDDWEFSLTSLREAKLLTVNREQGSGDLINLDAHPLLREYFARRVREQQPEAWREAHRRLYEHLYATTEEGEQPTLEDLQPLYQAVAHGCHAGLQRDVYEKVYFTRIKRQNEYYSVHKLGAFASDLGAIACFFDEPWKQINHTMTETKQALLLWQAAYYLRALGRLTEALEPMRTSVGNIVTREDWGEAASAASLLSELELMLGEVAGAVGDAEQSVTYADRSDDAHHRRARRTGHADALHQVGRRADAETRFREAEQMQKENHPNYPLLYGLAGFRYCDLLLVSPERAAWQITLECAGKRQRDAALDATIPVTDPSKAPSPLHSAGALQSCHTVSQRAEQALKIAERSDLLGDIALDHLTLGRAALYAAILERRAVLSALTAAAGTKKPNVCESSGADFADGAATGGASTIPALSALHIARIELDFAVAGLRRAGTSHHIPFGLLTRAWLYVLENKRTGPESAEADLDEAWEIAERGPMRLFMADIHLYRARLFGGMSDEGGGMKYPWSENPDGTSRGPKDDLAAAERLINECGYHRRDEELADAKAAAVNW